MSNSVFDVKVALLSRLHSLRTSLCTFNVLMLAIHLLHVEYEYWDLWEDNSTDNEKKARKKSKPRVYVGVLITEIPSFPRTPPFRGSGGGGKGDCGCISPRLGRYASTVSICKQVTRIPNPGPFRTTLEGTKHLAQGGGYSLSRCTIQIVGECGVWRGNSPR